MSSDVNVSPNSERVDVLYPLLTLQTHRHPSLNEIGRVNSKREKGENLNTLSFSLLYVYVAVLAAKDKNWYPETSKPSK